MTKRGKKFMKKTVVAICYDFDKTLTTDNMQYYSFIPNLNIDEATFWKKCTEFVNKTSHFAFVNLAIRPI